ncbi:hypothetical protein ACFL2F_01245 [Myxococcota bacterium]
MKKALVVLGALAFIFVAVNTSTAQQSTKDQAIDYNDKIIALQTRIIKSMIDFSKSFGTGDKKTMMKAHAAMVSTIESNLKAAKKVGPFMGDSKLRDAAVELFGFYDSISKKEYLEIVNILGKGKPGKKGLARINEIVESITVRENALDKKFQGIQVAFTKKYGIGLAENKMQKEIDNL